MDSVKVMTTFIGTIIVLSEFYRKYPIRRDSAYSSYLHKKSFKPPVRQEAKYPYRSL